MKLLKSVLAGIAMFGATLSHAVLLNLNVTSATPPAFYMGSAPVMAGGQLVGTSLALNSFQVSGVGSVNLTVAYTVSALPGLFLSGVRLDPNGFIQNGGSVTINAFHTSDATGTFSTSAPGTLGDTLTPLSTTLNTNTVTLDMTLTGTQANSFVKLSNMIVTYQAVPEPATMLGLMAGLGAFVRRRRSRNQGSAEKRTSPLANDASLKSVAVVAALVVVAGAQAATWNTTQFVTSTGTVTSVESTTPLSIKRTLGNATITQGNFLNIVWNFTFDTLTAPAFNSVTLVIKGVVNPNSVINIVGTEEIKDVSTVNLVTVGTGFVVDSFGPGAASIPFTSTVTIPIDPPTIQGFVTKDLNFAVPIGSATITEIRQEFTPVPEPATMAILGLGAAALLRRRRR